MKKTKMAPSSAGFRPKMSLRAPHGGAEAIVWISASYSLRKGGRTGSGKQVSRSNPGIFNWTGIEGFSYGWDCGRDDGLQEILSMDVSARALQSTNVPVQEPQ